MKDFGEALRIMRRGGKVARASWRRDATYLNLVEKSERIKPAAYIQYNWSRVSADGVFWVAEQHDLLADDWIEVF